MIRKSIGNFVAYLQEIKQPVFDKIASMISIISGVLTIVQIVVLTDTPILKFGWLSDIKNLIMKYPIGTILLTSYLWGLCLIVLIIKYRTSAIGIMNASTVNMEDLISDSKEALLNINSVEYNGDIKKQNGCQKIQEEIKRSKRQILNLIFIHYTISFLDKIKAIIEIYVGREVSTCFKMYVEYTENAEKLSGTVTLARDRESDKERTVWQPEQIVPLEENSDFYEIVKAKHISPNKQYFYQADLKKYHKKLESISDGRLKYNNSNRDWDKHYAGTIVVPVKSITTVNNSKQYGVLGFLCVDSKSRTAFTTKQKVINLKLLQSFAGIYSIVLEAYNTKLTEYSVEQKMEGKDGKNSRYSSNSSGRLFHGRKSEINRSGIRRVSTKKYNKG